jgi:hypothetical protein
MEYGSVVYLEGNGRLCVKESVREIDSEIARVGGCQVEMIEGVNF